MKKLILSLAFLLISNLAGAQTEAATKESGEWVFNTAAILECETRKELVAVLKDIKAAIEQGADGPALEAFLNLAELHADTLSN
jgi:uncharacterized membrane protein YgcG